MTSSRQAPATKTRLLDTAERLFGEKGFSATSLREITGAAQANVAAVNYHYGSKEALLRAVLERRLVPLNRERLERLDALEAELPRPDTTPELESLLIALLEPAMRLGSTPGGERFMRLLGRLHSEPGRSPARELFFALLQEVTARFVPLLRRAVPGLEKDELMWRMHFVIGAMAHTMMCSETVEFLTDGECSSRDVDGALRRLVTFAAAGLRAAAEAEVES